jgi:hypothetical protein
LFEKKINCFFFFALNFSKKKHKIKMSCPNPACEQYRIQHRNITEKSIRLENELRALQRSQDAHMDAVQARQSTALYRDAATGDMGLMMQNGEVMTREKVKYSLDLFGV